MLLQIKTMQKIIQTDHVFQIIHTNALLNLTTEQDSDVRTEKIYLYANDLLNQNINY